MGMMHAKRSGIEGGQRERKRKGREGKRRKRKRDRREEEEARSDEDKRLRRGSFFYARVQFKRSQNANVNVTVA